MKYVSTSPANHFGWRFNDARFTIVATIILFYKPRKLIIQYFLNRYKLLPLRYPATLSVFNDHLSCLRKYALFLNYFVPSFLPILPLRTCNMVVLRASLSLLFTIARGVGRHKKGFVKNVWSVWSFYNCFVSVWLTWSVHFPHHALGRKYIRTSTTSENILVSEYLNHNSKYLIIRQLYIFLDLTLVQKKNLDFFQIFLNNFLIYDLW